MYPREVENQFKEYAKAEYPLEACGFVLYQNGEHVFAPKKNISGNPKNEFEIDPLEYPLDGSLVAVVHSHPNGKREPSKSDMEGQLATNVAWGIVVTAPEFVSEILWWGRGVQTPGLMARPFRHGPSGSDGGGDCYALIKDWYLLNRNIQLPEFPRTPDWWENGESMYVDGFKSAGFEQISESEIVPGDVFLSQVRSKVPNHGGIYLGAGLVFHHLHNRLSKRDTLPRWKKYVTCWLHYVGDENEDDKIL